MNYDQIRAALSAAMHRNDPETIANEPNALELARAVIAQVFFPQESEVYVAAMPFVDGMALLPDDFGRAVAVGQDMGYLTPRYWNRVAASSPRDIRGKFTVYAGYLRVHPSITALPVVYNSQPQPIAGTATNWLATTYPMVWLHAARAEQYRFIEDNESAALADGHWRGLAAELAGESERSRQAGGAIRMKTR